MKVRTCPGCHHQFSFGWYVRKSVFRLLGAKWKCPQCARYLTFDDNRRFLLGLIALAPIFIQNPITLARNFSEQFSTSFWIALLVILVPYILWILMAGSFEKYLISEVGK